MFAWLTDVFASSGFAVGEAWAFRRNQQWQELRIALATWWLVRAVKAPFLWCSAWLARHGKVGVWSRRVWLAVGLLVCTYFGPGPVLGFAPWPMPGVIGWLAGLGLIVAFVVCAPRVRGLAILRPVKALVIVLLAYWPYWALSTATFHYLYGVDVWSPALWVDIVSVWNSGGNLRWSAFWLLVADTLVWYVLLVFLWARVARVWVALKRWGVRIMQWIIRASVFAILTYTVVRFMGFGFWQTVDQLASAVAAFPYAAKTVAQAPQWAIAFVLLVFGLIILNLFIIVLETVADVICFVSKMFHIVLHGGILNADKYDDEDVQPKRIVGLFERFDRYQHRVAIRCEAYARQQLINEMTSGITDDGFQESLEDDTPPEVTALPRRARRRWWSWGGAAPAAAEAASTSEIAVAKAPAAGAGDDAAPDSSPAPDGALGHSDLAPEEAVDELPLGPPDTTARDSFLAPDPAETDTPEGGREDGAAASDDPPETASTDAEEQTLDAAREEEQRKREDALARHQDALDEARQRARAEEEFARFRDEDGLDLLQGDPEDEEDPFDPNVDNYEVETDTEYEDWSSEPQVPSGPFGTPFANDEAPQSGSEEEASVADDSASGYGEPESAEEPSVKAAREGVEVGESELAAQDAEAPSVETDLRVSLSNETHVDRGADDPFGGGGVVSRGEALALGPDLAEVGETEPALDETVEAEFEDGPARTVSPVIEPEVVEVAALPSLLDDDSGLDLDDDAEVGEGFPSPVAQLAAGPVPGPVERPDLEGERVPGRVLRRVPMSALIRPMPMARRRRPKSSRSAERLDRGFGAFDADPLAALGQAVPDWNRSVPCSAVVASSPASVRRATDTGR